MSKGERVRRWRHWLFAAAAACLIAIPSLAVAADPVRASPIGTEAIAAITMEDHSDSFIAWRRAQLKNRIVIHIDSHIDLAWVSDSDLQRILNAKTTEELQELQLNPLHFEEGASRPLAILNYLYPAIAEGMVKKLYWVAPDALLMSEEGLLDRIKKHLIETLDRLSLDDLDSLRIQQGVITGRVYGIPLTICRLSDVPHFDEPVILDIDVDYFDPPRPHQRLNIPDIWPEEFIAGLMSKGMQTDLVSICSSVRGGYLPLEFKFLGDELADILNDPTQHNETQRTVRRHRKAGILLRAQGAYQEAVHEFRQALALTPGDASLHYWLGLLYNQMGKAPEASREIARAKAIDPIYNDALLYDADYAANRELYEKALSLYEQIIRNKPAYVPLGLFGAARCSSYMKQADKAIAYYQDFIKRYPNFYLTHFNLGTIYVKREQLNDAEREYKTAVALNPQYGRAYDNLGTLYITLGETDKAIEAFTRAIEDNPCFKESHNKLGSLYAVGGRYAEAIVEFQKAVRIDPRYVIGYSNLGKAYVLQGNKRQAVEAFKRVVSIEPDNPAAHYYLGRLDTEGDNTKKP